MRPPEKAASPTICCVLAGLLWLWPVWLLVLLSASHVSVGKDLRASWHQINGACFCPNPSVTLNCSLFCVSQTLCAEELAGGDNTLCYLLAEPVADQVCVDGVAIGGYCIALQLHPGIPPASEWCHRTHNPGTFGGGPFTFEPELLQSSIAPITRVSVSYGSHIKSVGVTFGAHTEAWTGWSGFTSKQCVLEPGEYINTVHVATRWDLGLPMPTALTFVTTRKTCGPYGQPGTSSFTYSGKWLVYIKGRCGSLFDQLEFVFAWC